MLLGLGLGLGLESSLLGFWFRVSLVFCISLNLWTEEESRFPLN